MEMVKEINNWTEDEGCVKSWWKDNQQRKSTAGKESLKSQPFNDSTTNAIVMDQYFDSVIRVNQGILIITAEEGGSQSLLCSTLAEAIDFEFPGKLCPGCLSLFTFFIQIHSQEKFRG